MSLLHRHVSMGFKIASLAGQDLRTPMMGGTRMPTEDSKGLAHSRLNQSQGAAEVGPMPTMGQLSPQGPKLKEVAVKMPSSKGSLPEIGQPKVAQAIAADPLIRYLKKQAEQLDTNRTHELLEGIKDNAPTLPQVSREYSRRASVQKDDLEKLFDCSEAKG